MRVQDAPTPLSLLLFLGDTGQLSCCTQQPTNSTQTAAASLDTHIKGKLDNEVVLAPDQLILRRHQLELKEQLDEDMIGGDIFQDVPAEEEETSDQDIDDSSDKYRLIKTREFWKSTCFRAVAADQNV